MIETDENKQETVTQQDKADAMVTHLASLAEHRLIISFAPYTPYYAVLKRIGELFPGPSKVVYSLPSAIPGLIGKLV